MPTYSTVPAPVKTIDAISEMRAALDELVARMYAAMAQMPGVFVCDYCREFKSGVKITTLAHTSCIDCAREDVEAEEVA